MNSLINYFIGKDEIFGFIEKDGSQFPFSIKSNDEKFDEVVQLCLHHEDEGSVESIIEICSPKKYLDSLRGTNFKIDKYTKAVYHKDYPFDTLPSTLADRIVDFVDNQHPITPLENFWINCMQNESPDSVQQLFSFLEKNKMPITRNGKFLAYKKVVGQVHEDMLQNGDILKIYDLKDGWTKRISNNPGDIVSMDRREVDDDKTRTCSTGLHVAAWKYAQNYSGNQLIEVIVNPKDVVAVPKDYDEQKMRVCEYYVYGIAEGERNTLFFDENPGKRINN